MDAAGGTEKWKLNLAKGDDGLGWHSLAFDGTTFFVISDSKPLAFGLK